MPPRTPLSRPPPDLEGIDFGWDDAPADEPSATRSVRSVRDTLDDEAFERPTTIPSEPPAQLAARLFSATETAPPAPAAGLDLDEPALDEAADSLQLDVDSPSVHPDPFREPELLIESSTTAAHSPLDDMRDRYAVGDFTGALVVAESILEGTPEDPEARRYAESCREVLTQMYSARLGPLTQIVTVAVAPDQVRWLSLDHRAGFLLSLVDGASTVEELLDISGMPRLEALRHLFMMLEQQVIALSPG